MLSSGMIDQILQGLSIAVTPLNLFYCFFGCLIGTLVGVLPGLGPVASIALLMPITYKLPAVSAIIMFAGIYYGAQYGGTITSVLMNIPGEATTVVTCIDGYQMTLRGRSGPALGIAAFGSFIGGSFAIFGLMLLAPPLAQLALKFGPPEYFSLILLSLALISYLGTGSPLKALIVAIFGMAVGTVGMDIETGIPRFTHGINTIYNGIDIVPVIMGMFGLTEVIINLEEGVTAQLVKAKIKGLLPNRQDWRDSKGPIFRGTFIGFFLGLIPGGGALISAFASYVLEKKISKHPDKFGHGAIEGVAGPETANNTGCIGAFVPMLSLGLPFNAITAILLGALMIHGVEPGPLFIPQHPDIFWGATTSMYLGNVILLVLNLPLIPLWVQILRIPYLLLAPIILLICLIGVYSCNYNTVDIYLMLIFAGVGYGMRKFGYEPAPFILGMILCPMIENAFRQSLIMSDGSFSFFFERPISAFFMIMAIAVMVTYMIPLARKKKKIVKVNL
jgi:putative tricarboxylic transport membrane protein